MCMQDVLGAKAALDRSRSPPRHQSSKIVLPPLNAPPSPLKSSNHSSLGPSPMAKLPSTKSQVTSSLKVRIPDEESLPQTSTMREPGTIVLGKPSPSGRTTCIKSPASVTGVSHAPSIAGSESDALLKSPEEWQAQLSPPPAPKLDPTVPQPIARGVSLQFILGLAAQLASSCQTSYDVMEQVVRVQTQDRRCAYVDCGTELVPYGCTGPATHYVCHRWGEPFGELVAALANHFANMQPNQVGIPFAR